MVEQRKSSYLVRDTSAIFIKPFQPLVGGSNPSGSVFIFNMIVLLSLLFLKHFLFDWVFQTDLEIQHKGRYFDSKGITHSVKHGIGTFLVFSLASFPLAITFGLLDTLIHYHIDFLKQNLTAKLELSPKDKMFWNLIGLDQFLHSLTYLGFALTLK